MTDFSNQAAEATERMRQLFPATPLQRNDHLSNVYDADIWLKREDLSPVRSYKLRGAFNAMGKQADKDVFVCASAGNHAQGVAYVCRHLQKKGVIFMPVTTPEQKIRKTRLFGGAWVQVQLVGDYFDDTLRASQAYCAEVGGHFLSPFDDPDVIEGQATVTYEMLEQLGRSPDVFVVPVGGGGLSSSARRLLSERAPETEIFYVEPSGGKSLAAAVQAGAPIALEQVDTFVDGAAVAKMGVNTFAALKGIDADHVLDIPEDRICTTILDMLNTEGIVLEPAGALALDALKDLKDKIKGKTVVCVSSGGNFDFERLPEVKERAQRYAGVKKYFILRLPQRPGALKDFLGLLGPDDDIARFEYLKKSARNFGTVLLGIETSKPENFALLSERLEAAGMSIRDITGDEAMVDLII
ncbi:MAG: threonine ammonia-lyase IlvA [Planktomarina temperata]|jgi:threonine dehydratase|uniref:L-threonine dehydratase n=2 Tax=Planktomarina TaxID=1284657 RepID=A0AAN0RLX2_9RHOB|nr:threonine dehydratase, biosynthetic [Planktomarina temperata RCA23]MBL6849462.1 threonine ammonia-lyase IlvA [Planktomarina temperata]MDB9966373.1 threonine ammonia-lyase IlvA [bacterium]MDP4060860.1 L-threonine dehydratase biosynthetic IlvA [Rhodobacteraceae bacterium LE17]MDA7448613.1 threonine ammonia-lyase IlvA [Planktomarina temperata]